MKKILMLNYEFPPLGGGAGNANYYLLKEFSKIKDLQIDLITCSANNKFEIINFSKNIRIHKLAIKKKNLHYWRMTELLAWSIKAYNYSKNFKEYDLIHAWFGWPCGVIAYLLKKPYFIALRGSDVSGYNPRLKLLDALFFKHLSRRVWAKAVKVIANSKGLKELALKTLSKEISIIPNGVDTNEFKPLINKKLIFPLKLVSTGRLIERKGYNYLIEAIKGNENVELTLIGEGNLMNELKNQAKSCNSNVKFLGKKSHEEVVKLLPKFDVFVMPSLNEGMSNSVLEAMACGLPVITTNVGGSEELIKGNGFIVNKADKESLKVAINNFLADSFLIKSLGNISRKLAQKMSWNKVAKQYLKVYNLCVE
ncbi:MAG: glycosyltransferase family 4 protein [Candidatus Nanoarchaeia archaeon]|jgi:glycosyltransferase involved in cell wall biosynthesis